MDDFGSGYSFLNTWRDIAFGKAKIDKLQGYYYLAVDVVRKFEKIMEEAGSI